MLDRLPHRSVVLRLDGDSYRLRDHYARTQSQRTATRTHPKIATAHMWETSVSTPGELS